MPDSIEKLLFKASNRCLFIVSDGNFIALNSMAEKLTGFTENQLIGRPFEDIITEKRKKEASKAFSSSSPEIIQTVGLTPTGSEYQVLLSVEPSLREGKPVYLVSFREIANVKYEDKVSDGSDNGQTVENLRKQTALVQLLHKVAVSANETNEYKIAFKSCLEDVCSFTGWPIGHAYILSPIDSNLLIPSDIWHLRDPNEFASFHEITMRTTFSTGIGLPGRVLASGKPAWVIDVMMDENFPRAKYAIDIGVHSAFAIPVIVDEEVVAVLEFFSDEVIEPNESLLQVMHHIGTQQGQVVARKRAEKELFKAKVNADIANMAKSELLANMSHELRTPLNAIIGFSDVLGDDLIGELANEKQREYIKDIKDSGKHLLKLINDVLDVSAIESGKVEIHEDNLVVGDLVKSTLRLIKPRLEKANLTFLLDASDNLPMIRADERRIKQILINLLTNAIKFTLAGGNIALSIAVADDETMSFSISDTGIGMNEKEIAKAMSQFGQVDGSITRKEEGTGLGLPLTKGLIELHGGVLAIKSEKGVGTTVTVTLPKERVLNKPKLVKSSR